MLLKQRDYVTLSYLRNHGRMSLTELGRKTRCPVSTLFDRIKLYNSNNIINKYTILLNYSKLGFHTRATIAIRVKKEEKIHVKSFLEKHSSVNSLYKVNNGFDFLFEVVFKHLKDMEDFIESFESKFNIKQKEVYYIIDEISRESFLLDNTIMQYLKR